ncbi:MULTISPECIES: DUF2269 family protein [unclassified Saccharopolyspora]|uniref:DUF2269 family protein n=1 Tax=unclassified Saccharopolyspora TaxID=2646250 RepID=UPI001CD56811|nr:MULTISPECIES: DUF2269 family protein [unclassified Saccharopolyspora]MCA1189564.1 DUF2269 family protein [Saccharopolyspora sp. 6T]MCA1282806.1 DUF2269 family protein [Saccharopolyspora sp. 7B]
MTKLLLSVHVLAAVLAIGPVAVAGSAFPRYLRAAATDPNAPAVLRALHRLCRVYALLGIVVPVFGLATASQLGVLGDAWLITSIVLTAGAAALLAAAILPAQRRALELAGDAEAVDAARLPARLGMSTGVFNLLWAVVVVLMIIRPGSTTGA